MEKQRQFVQTREIDMLNGSADILFTMVRNPVQSQEPMTYI